MTKRLVTVIIFCLLIVLTACQPSGSAFPIPGVLHPEWIHWINNSQYVYIQNNTLQLGDIGGKSTLITKANRSIVNFDAKDLDFQAGMK
jgi:hypothetical protein